MKTKTQTQDFPVGLGLQSGAPRGEEDPPSASLDAVCLFSALGQEAASFSFLCFSPLKKYVFLRLFDGFLVDIFYSS